MGKGLDKASSSSAHQREECRQVKAKFESLSLRRHEPPQPGVRTLEALVENPDVYNIVVEFLMVKENVMTLKCTSKAFNAVSLRFLDLSFSQIRDHQLLGLTRPCYTELTTLDLRSTRITHINPLSSLKKLKILGISATKITSIEPLKYCQKLTRLYCLSTEIPNIEALAFCPELDILNFSGTPITDITPLQNCKKLRILECVTNTLESLEPLRHNYALNYINLNFCNIQDIEPLTDCANLEKISLENTTLPTLEPLLRMHGLKEVTNFALRNPCPSEAFIRKGLEEKKVVIRQE